MRNLVLSLVAFLSVGEGLGASSLRVGKFAVDATPPLGTPLAYDEMTWVDQPLSCRGIVLLGDGLPVVLCALDWIGIANEGHETFRECLAEAVGTLPERVSVHTLHQHDAPLYDPTANRILTAHGLPDIIVDSVFVRQTMAAAAAGAQEAVATAVPISHVGFGKAEVEKVASNRRILGADGKVAFTRYTACRDPKIRAYPAGVVDSAVRLVSFWQDESPVAVLSFFATHPQSFYRTGGANPDFPGIARELRETNTGGVFHVHFNGAGGNVGAGKWNDGNKENRLLLALRLARGMRQALESTTPIPVAAEDLKWTTEEISLPVGHHLKEENLLSIVGNSEATLLERKGAARNLAWLRQSEGGATSILGCLTLGKVRMVYCPGEMVVEYQLAAQAMRPNEFVCLAAYGDYGPGYICLKEHYAQGGYEASERASRVDASVESVLHPALQRLLEQ